MITIFLITGLVLSLGVNIATFILIRNSLSKIATYEKYIIDFRTDVKTTLEKMREIDKVNTFATILNEKGLFESDDEVGVIFKDLEKVVENLNKIIE